VLYSVRIKTVESFLVVILFVALSTSLAPTAGAQTTYTYQGNPLTTFQGITCPPECSIRGYFTVPAPLPANTTSYGGYGYGSLNGALSITSVSFTDGAISLNFLIGLNVTTDSLGNIVKWGIVVCDVPICTESLQTDGWGQNGLATYYDFVGTYVASPQPGCTQTVPRANLPYFCSADNEGPQGNWTVAGGGTRLSIATSSLRNGAVGSIYSPQGLTATGGAAPYTWSVVSGALPDGLSLSGNAVSGTPTTSGDFNFTIQVTDNSGSIATQPLSIQIANISAPTNLRATQSGSTGTEIQLAWNYGGTLDSIDGFQIDRQTPSQALSGTWPSPPIVVSASSYCTLAATGSGLTCTYDDTVPVAYGTFNYRVRAYKGSTESPNSNEDAAFQVQVTTPLVPFGPSIPFGPWVFVYFSPEPGVSSVSQVAAAFGYDHFNWVSIIEHEPACYSLSPLHEYTGTGSITNKGNALYPPYLDPPLGGYWEYGQKPYTDHNLPWQSDDLPYYLDEERFWYQDPSIALNPDYYIFGPFSLEPTGQTAVFQDSPKNTCMGDNTSLNLSDPAKYIGFSTTLAGVLNGAGVGPAILPPRYDALASFVWHSTYTGSVGGITTASDFTPPTGGTGGIVNVSVINPADLSETTRALLVQSGAQHLSIAPATNIIAPMTAAFLSGQQGNNGWYAGPVTVTLIATDINGPSNIAGTTYSLDGGSSTAYSGPLTVYVNDIHTIQFASVDLAGNTEATESTTFKLDSTPPTISGTAAPSPNANGWNNKAVTVSFQCADALSGLAAGSPPAPTTLSTEGANQSVTGTCTDIAGNSASATVSGINIDKTPPTVACSTSPNVLWPPNNKLVPINVSVNVTDSLSGSAGFTLVSVTSNEPDSGQGDIQGFVTGTASTSGQLRAQRLGSGTGRVYTFRYTGADRAGNTTSCSTTVTVPHDQGQN
jgi:hypothetical protein